MSWFDSLLNGGNLLSGLGGIVLGGIGLKQQDDIFDQNIEFAKEKFDYDKNLQQSIFDREDNAVQRRVEDLKAAGINPLFAAGGAANAGSVVSTTAPHGEGSGKNAALANMLHAGQMAMNVLKMKSEIDHTNADTDRIMQQIKNDKERLVNEKEYLNIAYRNLDNDIARLGLASRSHELEVKRVLDQQTRTELERQRIVLEENKFELQKIVEEARIGNINADTAVKELQAKGISTSNARLILDYNITLHDFERSLLIGMRFKDSQSTLGQTANFFGGLNSWKNFRDRFAFNYDKIIGN